MDLKTIATDENLSVLNLSKNRIESFELLREQPRLTRLIASDCPIRFLNGLEKQPNLIWLELINTPLEREDKFRIRVIATVGDRLLKLNKVKVTDEERKYADLIRRKKPELLFIGRRECEDVLTDKHNVRSDELVMYDVYVKEHEKLFDDFAYNKAVIYDLMKFGKLPVIDETSTEYDIARATRLIKERNEALASEIKELREKSSAEK